MFCNCVANYTKPYCNTFQCTEERSGEVHFNLVISDTFARFFLLTDIEEDVNKCCL